MITDDKVDQFFNEQNGESELKKFVEYMLIKPFKISGWIGSQQMLNCGSYDVKFCKKQFNMMNELQIKVFLLHLISFKIIEQHQLIDEF